MCVCVCASRDFIAIKMTLTQIARPVDGKLDDDVATFRVAHARTYTHASMISLPTKAL